MFKKTIRLNKMIFSGPIDDKLSLHELVMSYGDQENRVQQFHNFIDRYIYER